MLPRILGEAQPEITVAATGVISSAARKTCVLVLDDHRGAGAFDEIQFADGGSGLPVPEQFRAFSVDFIG